MKKQTTTVEVQPATVRRSQVTVKTVLTITFTVIAVAVGLFVLGRATLAVGISITAAIVAVALDHAVVFLEKRKVPRSPAIAIVMLSLLALITGIFLLLIPPAVAQGRELATQGPELMKRAKETRIYRELDQRFQLEDKLEQVKATSSDHLQEAVVPGLKALGGVIAGVAGVVTVIFLTLFMLLFGGRLVRGLLDEAIPQRRALYERVLTKVYGSIGGYLSGLSFICLVNAVCTTLCLSIIRVPFFLPLGILSGLSSLLPLAGNTLVGIFTTLITFATAGVGKGIAIGIFFIIYQQFENHILGPMVYKRTVEVNPLVVMVSLLFFAELAGLPGALVAVPAVAAGQVILRELLVYRREQLQMALVKTTTLTTETVQRDSGKGSPGPRSS